MFDVKEVEALIASQTRDGAVKTAAAKTPAQTKLANAELQKQAAYKEAEDAYFRGQIEGKGLVDYILKTAEAMSKGATGSKSEGGKVEGAKITEQGSMMTETGNKLPTSKNNPSKSDMDEGPGGHHLTEKDLANSPWHESKAEARINKVMK